MPVYLFKCTACQNEFEELCNYYDPPPPCPACGHPSRRHFGIPALHFRGAGFHVNDYGRYRRRRNDSL